MKYNGFVLRGLSSRILHMQNLGADIWKGFRSFVHPSSPLSMGMCVKYNGLALMSSYFTLWLFCGS